ncbi:hypothetical protein II7_03678 [Bacillus cereus MSX-A12]|uniref:Uncharacterized protein n=3 Tax=root TaxID=1 RepID=A0A1B1P7V0_9CAUD|nr:hypothetical protein BI093_gp49 [Bacillus phage PfEFR-5]YP_009830777.1 hypothetical protein HWA96_gp48 [Bacillus phage PfEFR-4]ANT40188.1 hypothetical protein [Bacillus phage PfEFR-4]ANT40418.1 hypothetical protein [Bacillus phage PfEFR-5]EJR10488.1 hypothetical protein II7_03678 [Bacillus cereus MSX-A12]
MDYEKMWNELKAHYENRIEQLEGKQYDHPMNPRNFAKSIVNVMEGFEMKNQAPVKHSPLSIRDIREMAEL